MERTTPHSDQGVLLAIVGLGLVLLLVAMDQTIVGTALPRIAADLNGFSLYSWVTTAYLLTETAVIPIAGKLGDLYGRKWITLVGVVLFTVNTAPEDKAMQPEDESASAHVEVTP